MKKALMSLALLFLFYGMNYSQNQVYSELIKCTSENSDSKAKVLIDDMQFVKFYNDKLDKLEVDALFYYDNPKFPTNVVFEGKFIMMKEGEKIYVKGLSETTTYGEKTIIEMSKNQLPEKELFDDFIMTLKNNTLDEKFVCNYVVRY